MSTESPPRHDRSALGESWVVASTTSIQEHTSSSPPVNRLSGPTPAPRQERQADNAKGEDQNDTQSPTPNLHQNQIQSRKPLSGSLTSSTSSWSMSGPELVMPSIYEVPISEASWVAPHMRPADKDAQNMRKRRKITPVEKQQSQSNARADSPDAGSSAPGQNTRKSSVGVKLSSLYQAQRTILRTAINTLLIAIIMHLLVVPEIVYQARDLCAIPIIQSIYPASCIPLHSRPLPSNPFQATSTPLSPEETTIAAQDTLQAIFTSTLSTLNPLSNSLKDCESTLSTLQARLQDSVPDARHALALEFQGSDAALRAAAWEFDSLRADLRSAVDSLLASPLPSQPGGTTSIARDTRLAAQLRRRAEYLDRLRSQLRSKAESLGGRFATLDDHLEAIEGIVSREARRASMVGGETLSANAHAEAAGVGPRTEGLLHSLSNYAGFGAWLFSAGSRSKPADLSTVASSAALSSEDSEKQPASTLALLRLATTQHRAVADEIARLARVLRDEQRARSGSSW